MGDLISSNGSNKPNLAKRLSSGWGRVSYILGLVSEAPLGRWAIAAGLILRKALLINSILFNSEAWHNFTQNQVEAFEKIDEALIRGLVIGHAKVPVPALYLENGQVPIRYILACRRLLYLQTILQRDPDELVHKVYLAQRADPSQGDFCLLVDNDRLLLDCCLTDEQIGQTSKYDFRILVKKKAKEQAFRTLMSIKDKNGKHHIHQQSPNPTIHHQY